MGMLAETSNFFPSIYDHYNTNDKNKSFLRKTRINMLRCTSWKYTYASNVKTNINHKYITSL